MPSIPLKSDRQLKRFFNTFNRKFFDGQLPKTYVWWEPLGGGTFGDCLYLEEEKVWRIRINPFTGGWRAVYKVTLLHEMLHIKLKHTHGDDNDHHGEAFDAERRRLLEFKEIRDLVL